MERQGPSATPLQGDLGEALLYAPVEVPRAGQFLWWTPGRSEGPHQADTSVEVAVPTGTRVVRRTVAARRAPLASLLDDLATHPLREAPPSSVEFWAAATRTALALIARGRLQPGCTEAGLDCWRVGPFDRVDLEHLAGLAAACPPAAHALVLPGRPLRVWTPEGLLRAYLDAVADCFVRTASAAAPPAAAPARASARPARQGTPTSLGSAYRSREPINVATLVPWLTQDVSPPPGGARCGLRITLSDGPDAAFTAVVQLSSMTDPSLVIDSAELWDAPSVVLARLGRDAESDLLVSLRRASRIWPALGELLEQARPEQLVLSDEQAEDLLGDLALELGNAGIEVLWPADLGDTPTLRAQLSTAKPDTVVGGGFSLESLLEFRWQVTVGDMILDPEEIAQLAEAKRPLVRLRGRWVVVDPELLARLRRSPKMTAAAGLAAGLIGFITIDGQDIPVEAEGALGELVDRLRAIMSNDPMSNADGADARDLPEPDGLAATLRPYQRRGLAWLAELHQLGLGSCLADDMGLGKTIQIIALHLHADDGPTLVICPTTLLANWEREIHRFAPELPVRRYHGAGRSLDGVAAKEIVLSSYGVLRRDSRQLGALRWARVVADEAQHAKNPLSRTARALRTIPHGTRVALTGTPVENQLSDLWSLLDWSIPGLLGPLEVFQRKVAIPIERDADADSAERFTRLVAPFMLRRRKTDPDIAPDLPPKTETNRIAPLTAEQATLYEATVREALDQIAQATGIARHGLVFKLLTALKQLCNHPAQFLHRPGPIAGRSGKLALLDELLDAILAGGDSVLVFSQYTEMCRLIEAHLHQRGIATLYLHGKVPPRRRQELVDRFQAGEAPVFLLSLKAGGTGLNLTRATHVIHYDRWWNPAVEDQASDRAWRIGQYRPVQVHRLITEGTLEDRIAQVIERKRALAERVVGTGESWIAELSDTELAELVELGTS